MATDSSQLRSLPVAASMSARDVLHATWPLFQVSLPGCLPLAILGVAASATPGAEAVASGEGRGIVHSGEWWGLYLASTVLMLVCYGAILRQQLARAKGERVSVMDSMRQSMIGLPGTAGVVVLTLFIVMAGCMAFVLPGLAAIVLLCFGWIAQIDGGLLPLAALRRSFEITKPRFLDVAGVLGATLAAVLVFVLLTGILMAVVMNLAGQGAQASHTGLSFSRWLMAAVLSLPVVYIGAATVTAWRAVARTGP